MSQQNTDEKLIYTTWKDVPIPKKTIVFSLRVPRRQMQQLKYIADHASLSMNAICLMAVQSHTRKVLKEMEEYNRERDVNLDTKS